MYINSVKNNVHFGSYNKNFLQRDYVKKNALSQTQQLPVNKKPGLDNIGKSEISIFDRIRNSAIYFHNAYLYRRDAYNWDKQIADAKELRKNAGTVLCDFKNYQSEARCYIEKQAERIREKASEVASSEFVYLNDDEKVLYEKNPQLPNLYKATFSNADGSNEFVLMNWSDTCFDVDKVETSSVLSQHVEYSFNNGKLCGIQAQCLKGIDDSFDENDVVVEKEFVCNENDMVVTYKRPEGLNFDTKYHFENNILRRIDKASDAYARYISSYFYSTEGVLEEIKVQSYSETENGKYPVETVKSIKLTNE